MSSRPEEPEPPETPDADLPQDAGIPGFEPTSDRDEAPPRARKDEAAEARERLDEPDLEGHMTAPSGTEEGEADGREPS